jgi:hypothetical protein
LKLKAAQHHHNPILIPLLPAYHSAFFFRLSLFVVLQLLTVLGIAKPAKVRNVIAFTNHWNDIFGRTNSGGV